jgi:hypothetical protein
LLEDGGRRRSPVSRWPVAKKGDREEIGGEEDDSETLNIRRDKNILVFLKFPGNSLSTYCQSYV